MTYCKCCHFQLGAEQLKRFLPNLHQAPQTIEERDAKIEFFKLCVTILAVFDIPVPDKDYDGAIEDIKKEYKEKASDYEDSKSKH